jgi:ATP-binding cassette subfamily C (CFTR/MRP) protein 1
MIFLSHPNPNFFLQYVIDRWLALRLDGLSALFVCAVAFIGVGLRGSIDAGIISLSLTYSMLLTGLMQYTVRLTIELENNMVSTERLVTFSQIPSEAKYRAGNELKDSSVDLKTWPEKGEISFENVKLKYRPELDFVLRGISFKVQAREKIGVCGRTGSGKSTTMLALFRVIELSEGQIFIDGVDISKLGLGDLREKLCIIPQDPVLLSGSVRFNLDVSSIHLSFFIQHLPAIQ